MKCPHCGKKINAAAIMGAAGKGKPKDFSKAERKRRSDRMKAMNAKRRTESQNDQAQTRRE
jgi:hypothetical protein